MTFSKESISSQVNELLHREFEIPMEKLSADAKLYEDLALDSLDAVDMLVHLESTLGIKVAGEKFMHVRTLGDVYLVLEDVFASKSGLAPEAAVEGIPSQDL